ncbi:hypothetical protein, partial [Cardiobacterium hominis]|uniref:hypothetical protein n=1 Tax=Cardiobacterium hominis TaxID=2718 RepID=UPI0024911D96
SYCFKKNFIQKNIPDSSAALRGRGFKWQTRPKTSYGGGFGCLMVGQAPPYVIYSVNFYE